MVSDGNWSSLDAVYGLATTGTAQALLNIKSNGFALVPSGSPAFSSTTGYAGNGSTAILDTTFVPNFLPVTITRLNAASLTVCITNPGLRAAAAVFGVNQGSNASDLFPWYTDNNFYAELNANGTGVATSTNIQGIIISRIGDSPALDTDTNCVMTLDRDLGKVNGNFVLAAAVTGTNRTSLTFQPVPHGSAYPGR